MNSFQNSIGSCDRAISRFKNHLKRNKGVAFILAAKAKRFVNVATAMSPHRLSFSLQNLLCLAPKGVLK